MSKPRIPEIYLLGAPKCGTSAFAGYLELHPEISGGVIKEPNFWSFDMPHFAKREGIDSVSDYAKMYSAADARRSRYLLDASTHYLYSNVAVEKIASAVVRPKFIVCVRPLHEIAIAWHMQMLNAGYEELTSFVDAWSAIEARKLGHRIPRSCPEPKQLDYRGIASVGGQVDRVLAAAGDKSILVVTQKELRESPSEVLAKAWEFLDLDEIEVPVEIVRNEATRSRSAKLSLLVRNTAVRRAINKIRMTIGVAASRKLQALGRRILYDGKSRQVLPERTVAAIAGELESESQRLAQLDDDGCFVRCTDARLREHLQLHAT